jgi:hypothetical protein
MKKTFGVVFIILGSLLGLAFVTSVPLIIETVSNTVSDNSNNLTYSMGWGFYYVVHAGVTYLLFKYGFRWAGNASFKSSPILDEDLTAKNSDLN